MEFEKLKTEELLEIYEEIEKFIKFLNKEQEDIEK